MKDNPFPLPEVYLASQRKKVTVLECNVWFSYFMLLRLTLFMFCGFVKCTFLLIKLPYFPPFCSPVH